MERPAKKVRIVRRAAGSASLRENENGFFRVDFARGESVEELSDYDDRRIAGVVVDVAKPQFQRVRAHVREKLHVVAQRSERRGEDGEVNRRHLRNVEGRALFELGLLRLFVVRRRVSVRDRGDRDDAVLFRAAAVVQGRHQGAKTNASGAEGVAFVDLEERVELPFGFEKPLHLFARHGVKTAAETYELHDFDVGVLERVFGRAV